MSKAKIICECGGEMKFVADIAKPLLFVCEKCGKEMQATYKNPEDLIDAIK